MTLLRAFNMGPQDYTIKAPTFMQSIMEQEDRRLKQENQDKQFGLATRQLDMREGENVQRQKNYEEQFGYTKDLNDKKAAAIEAQKIEAEAKVKEIADFAAKPNKTAQDYSDMINRHPDLATSFKSSYNIMEDVQKENYKTFVTQTFSAIENGAIDVAETLLIQRMDAANNSGNKAEAAGLKATLDMLKTEPEAAKATMGLFLASADPDAFKAVKMEEEKTYKRGQDRKANARADKKLDAEIKKTMIAETAAAKKAGMPRNTTTAEMQSLFNYGDEQGVDLKDVAAIMKQTRGKPVEERLAAIDDFANGGETKADTYAKDKGIPAKAIERLKNNPKEAAQFDEIFGAGASERVLR